MAKEKNKIRGKKSREAGQRFERKVRKNLESQGWIVDKWTDNVDLGFRPNEPSVVTHRPRKLIPAKSNKFNTRNNGFPDFIAFQCRILKNYDGEMPRSLYEIIGVESKMNGYLKKEEKEKCKWLIKKNIFSKILIASRGKKRGEIIYKEFK